MPLVHTYLHLVAQRFEHRTTAEGGNRQGAARTAARAAKLSVLFSGDRPIDRPTDVLIAGLSFLGSNHAIRRLALFAGEAQQRENRYREVIRAGRDHRSIAGALTVLWEEHHGPHTVERAKPLMLHHAAAAWEYADQLAVIRLAGGAARVAAWTEARLRLRARGAAGITGEATPFARELEAMIAAGEIPGGIDALVEGPTTDADLDGWAADLAADRVVYADFHAQARVLYEASRLGQSPEASLSTPAWWRGPLLVVEEAVQTAPGDYTSRPLTADEARWAVRDGIGVVNGIAAPFAAVVAGEYLGRALGPCAGPVVQAVGQHAIVCRVPPTLYGTSRPGRELLPSEAVAEIGMRFEVMTRLS